MREREAKRKRKRIYKLIALLTGASCGPRAIERNTVASCGKPVRGKNRARFKRELAKLALQTTFGEPRNP